MFFRCFLVTDYYFNFFSLHLKPLVLFSYRNKKRIIKLFPFVPQKKLKNHRENKQRIPVRPRLGTKSRGRKGIPVENDMSTSGHSWVKLVRIPFYTPTLKLRYVF